MNRLTALLGVTLGLAATGLPAWAGGPVLVIDEAFAGAAAAPVRDWQGPYLGIAIGKPTGDNVFGRSDLDIWSTPADWSGTPTSVKAGYDWQRGRMVFGVVIEATVGDISNPTQPSAVVICFDRCEIAVSAQQSLRGRVGYTFGRNLVYATAGMTSADARFTAVAGVVVIGEAKLNGWTAGMGFERKIGKHLTLSAEYRHTDLGALPLSCFDTCQSEIAFGLMQVGVNYRW
jgi:outer membrane immunogenic protein